MHVSKNNTLNDSISGMHYAYLFELRSKFARSSRAIQACDDLVTELVLLYESVWETFESNCGRDVLERREGWL